MYQYLAEYRYEISGRVSMLKNGYCLALTNPNGGITGGRRMRNCYYSGCIAPMKNVALCGKLASCAITLHLRRVAKIEYLEGCCLQARIESTRT